MTPDLDKLSELAGKASEGPWFAGPRHTVTADAPVNVPSERYKGFDSPDYDGRYLVAESVVDDANAAFIAASRQAIPALIEEVRRLRKVLAWYGDLALYECPNPTTCTAELCVLGDKGQRAREVLK